MKFSPEIRNDSHHFGKFLLIFELGRGPNSAPHQNIAVIA